MFFSYPAGGRAAISTDKRGSTGIGPHRLGVIIENVARIVVRYNLKWFVLRITIRVMFCL